MQSRKTKIVNPNKSQTRTIQTDENFLAGQNDLVPIVSNKQNPTRSYSTRQNQTRMPTNPKFVPLTPGKYINASPYWPDWSES